MTSSRKLLRTLSISFTLITMMIVITSSVFAGGGEWTWVDGATTYKQWGIYGTEDTPDAANVPGARSGSVSWRDNAGNLWLFGGFGYDASGNSGHLNDLWKFDPATGLWTWVDGPTSWRQAGTYGTEDIPHDDNVPGMRAASVSWIDSNGNLWLFGGVYYHSIFNHVNLNDLWMFSPATEQWTWVDGSDTHNQPGTYGTEDIPHEDNVPGARYDSVSWVDSSDNLWLFGGYGFDAGGNQGNLNDLWMFNPGTGQWTWVDGSPTRNQGGTYGTEDTAHEDNVPGARASSVSWSDSSDNLWLFGGFGSDGNGGWDFLNDLWMFNPGTDQWTWVDGSEIVNQRGTYGTEDIPDTANVPGARCFSVSWSDNAGNLWLFGGNGHSANHLYRELNDLWMFDPGTGQWTWVDGSNAEDQPGTYGAEDIPDAENVPGARSNSVGWSSIDGNLWLFGGSGYDEGSPLYGYLNDLWMFDTSHVLETSAACNGNDLEVTITDGDGPFNITGKGANLPSNGVNASVITIDGPSDWTGLTVTETDRNLEFILLDDITCPPVTEEIIDIDCTISPEIAAPGEFGTFACTIRNNGTVSSGAVDALVSVPAGASVTTVSSTKGTALTESAPEVKIRIDDVSPNEAVRLFVNFTLADQMAAIPHTGTLARLTLQSAGDRYCMTGRVREASATACLSMMPDVLPDTGGEPASSAWITAALAALILFAGGFLWKRRTDAAE